MDLREWTTACGHSFSMVSEGLATVTLEWHIGLSSSLHAIFREAVSMGEGWEGDTTAN